MVYKVDTAHQTKRKCQATSTSLRNTSNHSQEPKSLCHCSLLHRSKLLRIIFKVKDQIQINLWLIQKDRLQLFRGLDLVMMPGPYMRLTLTNQQDSIQEKLPQRTTKTWKSSQLINKIKGKSLIKNRSIKQLFNCMKALCSNNRS